MTTPAQPETVLDAYLARHSAIAEKLERLQALTGGVFNTNPDSVHWGHVGDLVRIEALLDEILTIAQ